MFQYGHMAECVAAPRPDVCGDGQYYMHLSLDSQRRHLCGTSRLDYSVSSAEVQSIALRRRKRTYANIWSWTQRQETTCMYVIYRVEFGTVISWWFSATLSSARPKIFTSASSAPSRATTTSTSWACQWQGVVSSQKCRCTSIWLYMYMYMLHDMYSHHTVLITSFFLQKVIVRSGIRTHAWKTRLRPERSALDRSSILTTCWN